MTATVTSAANLGYAGRLIQIECDTSNGLPSLIIVGLANKAIEESKERIRSAIRNSKLEFPRKRIILNLAPADLPKDGSSYDVPMALSILASSGQLPAHTFSHSLFVGELALDGQVRPIRGVINAVETAKQAGLQRAFVPAENAAQAALVAGIQIISVLSLSQLYKQLIDTHHLTVVTKSADFTSVKPTADTTFTDIRGQLQAKRALVIAAAGQHNLLLSGPPGSGKTMLARALRSLLPPPSPAEIIAITKLHNLAGQLQGEVATSRPFRSPHHTASATSLLGGGSHPKPGEISLAHKGVLFLDELPEFPRYCLEALRQPLEDRQVTITRAAMQATYPADFMLVATQNPCPCGFLGDTTKQCSCTQAQIAGYQQRLSGPLLDRIDLHLTVNRIPQHQFLDEKTNTETLFTRSLALIAQARQLQQDRFCSTVVTNTHLSHKDIHHKAHIETKSKQFLRQAATKLDLSARGTLKVIRVARTIADLAASEQVKIEHLSEALQYRQR